MALLYRDVWDTLSQVNVNEHTEEKMGLTYLSWAWAWGTLMEHYPEATFVFTEFDGQSHRTLADGSAEVECTVTIPNATPNGLSRTMWLPVMDNRNNAVRNPNARQVSDIKMRCLTKCLALLGLGHYIYGGEGIPQEPVKKAAKVKESEPEVMEEIEEEIVDPSEDNGFPEDYETKRAETDEMIANLMTRGDLELTAELCVTWAKTEPTVPSLLDFWNTNSPAIDKLQSDHPDLFKTVKDAFTKRRLELTEDEEQSANEEKEHA